MTRQISRILNTDHSQYDHLNYLVYLPEDYSVSDRSWPVIMYLHGEDDRGDQVEMVETYGLPLLLEHELTLSAIVISPQCPQHTVWSNETQSLYNLFEQVQREFNVDPSRMYMTGWSMGGFGAWKFAIDYPDYLAAIAPLSSCLLPSASLKSDLKKLHSLPIWTFHGQLDGVVPPESTQYLVDQIKENNPHLKYSRLDNYSHDIWQSVYNEDYLYDWLFVQKKPQIEHA